MRALPLAGLLLLAACGAQQRLRPAAGESMPPKPATAPARPTAMELLTPPSAVRPGRSDELVTKSQERTEDRFDVPPH